MTRHKSTPGISRIDQVEKRTHGFFVRLARRGKIYNAFFTDKKYGGKKKALAAAQKHYQALLRQHGKITRQEQSRRVGRPGASGIHGVRRVLRRGKHGEGEYWQAAWSPFPNVHVKKQFAVSRYGRRLAKLLAKLARAKGVLNMAD